MLYLLWVKPGIEGLAAWLTSQEEFNWQPFFVWTQPWKTNLWPRRFGFILLLYHCQVLSRETAPRLMAPDPPAWGRRQQEPKNHSCNTSTNWIPSVTATATCCAAPLGCWEMKFLKDSWCKPHSLGSWWSSRSSCQNATRNHCFLQEIFQSESNSPLATVIYALVFLVMSNQACLRKFSFPTHISLCRTSKRRWDSLMV